MGLTLHSELYEAVNTVSECLAIQSTMCIIKFGPRFIWTSVAKPDPYFGLNAILDPKFGLNPTLNLKFGLSQVLLALRVKK